MMNAGVARLFSRRVSATTLSIWQSVPTILQIRAQHTEEAALAAARKWLHGFTAEQIPPRICDLSYSRSSGPGGQNVNK
jgi:protein subunit release factor B